MSIRLKIMSTILIINLATLIILLIVDMKLDSEAVLSNSSTEGVFITTTESLDNRMEDYLIQEIGEIEDYNSNRIGNIKIEDTTIEYPIMYSSDLMYYTKHDCDNDVSNSGAIFLDSRIINTDNEVLLIHGLTTEDGDMFSPLVNYEDVTWATMHNYVSLKIMGSSKSYKLFAVIHTVDSEPIVYLEHADELAYENFYSSLVAQSLYADESVEFTADKQMIILNTVNDNGHYLVCFLEEK